MRQQCLMTSKLKKIVFFQQCGKLTSIINELSVKASRALKHAADVIADSPAALQVIMFLSDILIIIIFMIITTIIIIVFLIIILIPAPLPANAEQHLCREQQHDYLPHSHRHHLATLHCQTNPEKGAFFRSARTSCTAFDWPVRGQEFSLSSSSLPQNYGLHGSQVGLTCQVHLV